MLHGVTTTYPSKSIGNTERLSQTLMNMTRKKLQSLRSSHEELWTEAIYTSYFTKNKLFTKSCLKTKPFFEKIHKDKPNSCTSS